MTKILLEGLTDKIATAIATKLIEMGNEVEYHPENTVLENYEEYLPDLVLMNYADETFFDNTSRVVEFDNTACIFALAGVINENDEARMYKNGVRVIMDKPEMKTLDTFIDGLFNSCNDLEHEKCIGCWKLDRFENLKSLN